MAKWTGPLTILYGQVNAHGGYKQMVYEIIALQPPYSLQGLDYFLEIHPNYMAMSHFLVLITGNIWVHLDISTTYGFITLNKIEK